MSSRSKSDFYFRSSPLGEGAFSRVYLARSKYSDELIAVKIMEKSFICKCRPEFVNVKNELSALVALQHDATSHFIISLLFAFQDSKYLYIGTDISYQTLRQYVYNIQTMNENAGQYNTGCVLEVAQFIISQLVVAIQYIHNKNIIHRDLNPSNILLSKEGHVRVADFGASLVGVDPLNPPQASFVGLADYIPPEVLDLKTVSTASDLWALGCLSVYIIVGVSPFFVPLCGRTGAPSAFANEPIDEYATYQEIRQYCRRQAADAPRSNLCGEDVLLLDAEDLVAGLLVSDPEKRLGVAAEEELRGHQFFAGLSWTDLHLNSSPLLSNPNSFQPDSLLDESTERWQDGVDFEF